MAELAKKTTEARSIGIIIPVYNEKGAISDTLRRVRAVAAQFASENVEIICVDDGSRDGTADILAAETGITVLTHQANRGYGAALRTGLRHSTQEWICIVDSDGTYPLEDLPRLFAEAQTKDVYMVVGARQGTGITRNPFKRLARYVLRKMAHRLTGIMIPDLNSGMRVFRHKLYDEFGHLLPLGFSFTTTLTLATLYSGYKTLYVPIQYNARIGSSNIKPIRDFLGFTMLLVRIASYFEPLRFFLPVSAAFFMLGLAKGVRDIIVTRTIGSLAVITIVLAIQIFVTGILADVIVRRSNRPRGM